MSEKIEKRTNFGPILIVPFLLNLCHGYIPLVITGTINLDDNIWSGKLNYGKPRINFI